VLYEDRSAPSRVMDAGNAFLLTDMLRSAVEYGTAARLNIEGVPLSCKTGTTDYDGGAGNSDAWAVAYNPEYIACAWMGFDKTDDTHYLSRSVTGGSGPAKLLKQIFTEAHPGGGPSFTVPDNVVRVTLDADTLKLAYPSGSSSGTFTEYFIKGTEPQQTAFPFLTITPSFSPSPSVSPDGLYSPEPSHSETAPYGTDGTASPRASPTKKPTPRPTRMVLPSPGLFDH